MHAKVQQKWSKICTKIYVINYKSKSYHNTIFLKIPKYNMHLSKKDQRMYFNRDATSVHQTKTRNLGIKPYLGLSQLC